MRVEVSREVNFRNGSSEYSGPVIIGLVPLIPAFIRAKTWMAETSPAMTRWG